LWKEIQQLQKCLDHYESNDDHYDFFGGDGDEYTLFFLL